MPPSPPPKDSHIAVLIGSSGDVAGRRFEVGADTSVGMDAQGRIAVVPSSAALAKRFFRLYLDGGSVCLEPFGAAGDTTLDTVGVDSVTRLDRRHVIGIRSRAEFVFSAAASPDGEEVSTFEGQKVEVPPRPAPGQSGRHPVAEEATEPSVRETVRGTDPFGVLPVLKKGGSGGLRAIPPAGPQGSAPPAPPANDVRKTQLGSGGFDAIPNLVKAGKPKPISPSAVTSKVETAPPGPPPQPTAPTAHLAPMRLTVVLPEQGEVAYVLKYGENVVGRGSDCDITVPDSKKLVSRKHAIIRVEPDRVLLIDLDAANGTYVDGVRVTTSPLTPDMSFSLGPSLTFTLRRA